ncbi:MAG: hypothetical protein J6A59_14530 [Lachnospiraceae bacterium]|nr:hypothetical protein [Lachnospiraceae bacterium]
METQISEKLKQRFCKDNNITVQIFSEPFFSERLEAMGMHDKYLEFLNVLDVNFNNSEEEYFKYYNELKDTIIDYIKKSEAFESLNTCDMSKYATYTGLKQSDVYKVPNIGKNFISIDIKKANFSVLVHYAKETGTQFFDSYSWEDFMKQFTDIRYFAESKYIRQVVFGNCNPKRQVTYEKYLVTKILDELISNNCVEESDVYSISSDELIINVDSMKAVNVGKILDYINDINWIPLRITYFKLGKVENTDAYIKKIYDYHNWDIQLELKCVKPSESIFIHRALNKEELTENDKVFISDGRLAKFIDIPKIRFVFNK